MNRRQFFRNATLVVGGGVAGSLATATFWQKGDNKIQTMPANFENNLFVRTLDAKTRVLLTELNHLLVGNNTFKKYEYNNQIMGEAYALFSKIKIHSAAGHTAAELPFGNRTEHMRQSGRTVEKYSIEYDIDRRSYFSEMLGNASAWTMPETVAGTVWLRKKDDIGLLQLSLEAYAQLQDIKGIAKEAIRYFDDVLKVVGKK